MASIIRAAHIGPDAVTLGVPPAGAAARALRLASATEHSPRPRDEERGGDEYVAFAPQGDALHAEEPAEGIAPAVGVATFHESARPVDPRDAEIAALRRQLAASEESLADIRAQAEADLQALRDGAKQSGFDQGLAQGMEAAQQQVDKEVSLLRGIAQQLAGLEHQAVEAAEDSVVEMAYMAVCKLVGDAVANGSAVKGVVALLMERTRGTRIARIRMRADDCSKLTGLVASGALGANLKGIDFQPDDSIAIGGCVLEGDAGTLDARLEIQLDNLRAALVAARAGSV